MSAPTIDEAPAHVDFGDRSARRRSRLRILLAVVGVLVVASVVWAVWFSTLLAVKSVRVVGADGAQADAVIAAASVPVGVPLARVDAGAATARVLALPWVASVEVRRGWPNDVVIAVAPRVPLAMVTTPSGRRAVDADGVPFIPVGVPAANLPTVKGEGVGLETAMAVLASLPPDLAGRVATVSATTRDDADLVFKSGTTVHWGSAEQPEFKAEVLRALMRHKRDVYDVSAPELPTTFSAS